jgi:hypothetical protein
LNITRCDGGHDHPLVSAFSPCWLSNRLHGHGRVERMERRESIGDGAFSHSASSGAGVPLRASAVSHPCEGAAFVPATIPAGRVFTVQPERIVRLILPSRVGQKPVQLGALPRAGGVWRSSC